jgi:peptide/nickel transport system permease protein
MNGRLGYLVRRVLLTIPVLVATSIFVFLLIRLVPGDPVRSMLGIRANPENIATVRQQLGLDRPLVVQYWDWIRGALHGNLGQDFISHEQISRLLSVSLPITLELTILAMALALLVGVPLGVLVSVKAGWVRKVSGGFVVGAISIPDFWLGLMLVLVFTGAFHLLPPTGWVALTKDPVENLRYMVLPVVTLATGQSAYILRTTRAAMLGTLSEPYIVFLSACMAQCLRPDRHSDRHPVRGAARRRHRDREPFRTTGCRPPRGHRDQRARLRGRPRWCAGRRLSVHCGQPADRPALRPARPARG